MDTYATHATRHGASLACFPECFLQEYCPDDGYIAEAAVALTSSEFDRVLRSLKHLEPTVVVGSIERTGNTFFHSAVTVQSGNLAAAYRKTHLLDSEQTIFQPGDDHPVFDFCCGTTLGINICYDLNSMNRSKRALAPESSY
ncbi:MAG: carbon-nitrogen hydrolase family protein [Nitrospira sp.]|nr:carbon-nitrogen hydrolase family protein [Nitrospira sp.]